MEEEMDRGEFELNLYIFGGVLFLVIAVGFATAILMPSEPICREWANVTYIKFWASFSDEVANYPVYWRPYIASIHNGTMTIEGLDANDTKALTITKHWDVQDVWYNMTCIK